LSRASGGSNHPSTYFSTADNNRWCRPLSEANVFNTLVPSSQSFTLATWKPFINNEAHSFITPYTIANVSELRFEYNATTSSLPISLGANYLDVFGTNWSGTLTLAPFTSIILKTNGNSLPGVSAGPDISINLPTNSVTMAGDAIDEDGTIASYHWSKISGPSTFTITNAALKNTTITNLIQGVYQFQLDATDNAGGVGSAIMKVTVNAAVNTAPVANAGADKNITLPTNSATLDGSASTDAEGPIAIYQWSKILGPSTFAIVSSSQAVTAINNLVQGVYQFELKVTDNSGAIDRDTAVVTVNAASNPPPIVSIPGGNQITITQPTNSTSVTGSSSDPGGSIASVQWTVIGKPAGATDPTFTAASSNTTTVNNLVAIGAYTIRYTATDNLGAPAHADVIIQVNGAANQLPVANAGADKNITLPTNSVTLNGSGTDADGTIAAYLWSKILGPATYTIVSSSQAQTAINNLVQGVYQFELKVTDNSGAIDRDTVVVTVNAASNPPPIVTIPGGNQITITQPTNSTSVTGSSSDPGGSIASVQWTVVGKPTGAANPTFTAATSNTTTVNNLLTVGAYTVRYTATDNLGATAYVDVIIQVNGAANQSPIANAGADFVDTLPRLFSLDGSASSDPDGPSLSYRWLQISGPTLSAIQSASQAKTNVSGIQRGFYKYQLRVTDNAGAIGLDTVQVEVYDSIDALPNAPPVANAGPNYRISLGPFSGGSASITITGSAVQGSFPITSYEWTKIAGPSQYTIADPNSASTAITGLVKGTYQFQLKVTDGKGLMATDIIVIDVTKNFLQFSKRVIIKNF
jgi:hypothetical protein